MKKILSIFCSTILVISCTTKQAEPDSKATAHNFEMDKTTLYVVTVNSPEPDSNKVKDLSELPPVKKDDIRQVKEDSLKGSINKSDGSGFIALGMITGESSDQRNSKIGYICDWCGWKIKFMSPEGFLDYMSARGYKVATQTENNDSRQYVFQKTWSNSSQP